MADREVGSDSQDLTKGWRAVCIKLCVLSSSAAISLDAVVIGIAEVWYFVNGVCDFHYIYCTV